MADSARVLLLLHPVEWPISEAEARDALTASGHSGVVDLVVIEVSLGEHPDWEALARTQAEQYRERVAPRLAAHPDTTIAYFGSAPVPLAVHLGSLVPSWAKVRVWQRHHERKTWPWSTSVRTKVRIVPRNVPTDISVSTGDVVLRASVSYPVHAVDTGAVTERTIAEVDVTAEPMEPDALASPADLEEAAACIHGALLATAGRRPRADRVHLFLAGPCGLAFRVGSMLSGTVTPILALYQFRRTSEPHHLRVLELGAGPLRPEPTPDDRVLAQRVRDAWRGALDELTLWVRERSSSHGWWLETLDFPDVPDAVCPASWRSLAALGTGRFGWSTLTDVRDVDDDFRYHRDEDAWDVGDALLAAIGGRVPEEHWGRAARLFFLHEALHEETQRVTAGTARRIGRRHPLLAEEFDYRADVWALLHELKFSWERGPSGRRGGDDPVAWLRRGIDVLTEVLWAFVPLHEARRQLELRRLRRFTQWYWQSLELAGDADLGSAIARLFEKPMISVSGPPIHSSGGRTWVLLDQAMEFDPEVALLVENRLLRPGTGDAMDLRAAFDGLRRAEPAALRRALRGLHDQVATSRKDSSGRTR